MMLMEWTCGWTHQQLPFTWWICWVVEGRLKWPHPWFVIQSTLTHLINKLYVLMTLLLLYTTRLPFRLLVRHYGADICYTPMIMADSFMHSALARDLEFQKCPRDQPLVVQFAARHTYEFVTAAQLVGRWVEGVDLNCGCPQGWAAEEGVGACLMKKPDLIADMVQGAKRVTNTPISVKIRIFKDAQETVELARRIEAAGAAWITVHGRMRSQKSSEPANWEMIKLVKDNVNIPVIANGDANSLADVEKIASLTGVNGVMSARSLLENPGLFAGHEQTDWEVVDFFTRLSLEYGTSGPIFHHHLSKMTASLLSPSNHRAFNALSSCSIPTMLEFLDSISKSTSNTNTNNNNTV